MILKFLLNTQMIWMIFITIRKKKIQINNVKYGLFLMMWLLILLSNKKLNPIVTDLFTRDKKLNISLVFIKQSYFTVPKNIRLNSTRYFIMKIPMN